MNGRIEGREDERRKGMKGKHRSGEVKGGKERKTKDTALRLKGEGKREGTKERGDSVRGNEVSLGIIVALPLVAHQVAGGEALHAT